VQASQGQVVVQVPAPPPPIPPVTNDPREVYQAFRNQRRELANQLDNLEDQRSELARTLINTPQSETASRQGLEQRIAAIDQRIITLDKQIEEANAAVARAAAVPGAIMPDMPPPPRTGPPEEFWVIAGLILVPAAFILTVAYARRLWRRGAAAVASIPQDIYDRFTRVEQSIDSVAVEVERIGEGQRYLTRLMAERPLSPGAAQPVEVKQKEADKVR
jgi:hypothetical protein